MLEGNDGQLRRIWGWDWGLFVIFGRGCEIFFVWTGGRWRRENGSSGGKRRTGGMRWNEVKEIGGLQVLRFCNWGFFQGVLQGVVLGLRCRDVTCLGCVWLRGC